MNTAYMTASEKSVIERTGLYELRESWAPTLADVCNGEADLAAVLRLAAAGLVKLNIGKHELWLTDEGYAAFWVVCPEAARKAQAEADAA